jgi:hypothetical protein
VTTADTSKKTGDKPKSEGNDLDNAFERHSSFFLVAQRRRAHPRRGWQVLSANAPSEQEGISLC